MSIVLGIDVGGSTTKIVGVGTQGTQGDGSPVFPAQNTGEPSPCVLGMLQVRAADQITSMYGAIGNFLSKYGLKLQDISKIFLTGVGASFISEQIYEIETLKVDEFSAIGRGALRMTGLDKALVVSMGTGTAIVQASTTEVKHIGGSGVGGGSIIGLSSLMLGKSDIDAIIALAEKGSLESIDLSVSDILGEKVQSLPFDLTAANFGKIKSTASDSDVALGIINMVFEAVGMLAVFAAKSDSTKDIVLTGTLATFPQANPIFAKFTKLTDLNFIIPKDAMFATALGAIK